MSYFIVKLDDLLKTNMKTDKLSSYKKYLIHVEHQNLEIEVAVNRIQTHSKMQYPVGSVGIFARST